MTLVTPRAAVASGRLDIGRVGQETFRIIGADFVGTYGLAAGLTLISGVLSIILAATGLSHPAASPFMVRSGAFGPNLLVLPVGLVVGVMTYGALGWGAVQQMQGRSPSIGSKLSAAAAALLPMLGVGVLGYLGIVVGTILLVVPGIFLCTMWIVSIVAAVVDREGVFGSFSRSAELTKTHRWKIFLLLVIYTVCIMLLGLLQLALMRGGMGTGPVGITALATVFSVIIGGGVNAVGATGAGVIYEELRRARGEFDTGRLDALFG